MPRSKRNVKRAVFDMTKMEKAVKLLKEKFTLHGAAKHFGIPRASLRRCYNCNMTEDSLVKYIRKNLAIKKVFNDEQKRLLVAYIKEAAMLQFGLTLKEKKIGLPIRKGQPN